MARRMESTKAGDLEENEEEKQQRSSYLMRTIQKLQVQLMLSSITSDLDLLLSDLCDLYSRPEETPPEPKPKRNLGKPKKPMQFENCSAFGGSSTSGTLTSTDSNTSSKNIRSGTLTSTDSNESATKPRGISIQSDHLAVFSLKPKGLEIPGYPERHSANSFGSNTSDPEPRQLTLVERLTKTHSIWFLPEVGRAGAVHLLKDREAGTFIVRKSSRDDTMALSIQFPTETTTNVDHYLIESADQGLHLQGSVHFFKTVPNLCAYYCERREELPHRLVLPPAISRARTSQELAALNMLGQDFWTSAKFDGSRASSKTSLVEPPHPVPVHKSISEPISIAHESHAHTCSQSQVVIDNSPPSKTVIDFSAYLIKKRNEVAELAAKKSDIDSGNVQSEFSMSAYKQSECPHHQRVPSSSCKHKCISASQSDSALQLHNVTFDTDTGYGEGSEEVDTQTPHHTHPKSTRKKGKSNLYFTTSLDLLPVPGEETYFASNLSDKMSDYEDIWKNTATPSGSVCADMAVRLQQPVFNGNSAIPVYASPQKVKKDVKKSPILDKVVGDKCKTCEELSRKDFQRSMSVDTGLPIQRSMLIDVIPDTRGSALSIGNKDGQSSVLMCENKKVRRSVSVGSDTDIHKSASIDTIPEHCNKSYCCHSNCNLNDGSSVDSNSKSVQTQTSPAVASKSTSPPSLSSLPKKCASTSSLGALKSPVYSEPFDAITNEDESPERKAKVRRVSAPAVGYSRYKLKQTDFCPQSKLETIFSPRLTGEEETEDGTFQFVGSDEKDGSAKVDKAVQPQRPFRRSKSQKVQTHRHAEMLNNRKSLNEAANRLEQLKLKNLHNSSVRNNLGQNRNSAKILENEVKKLQDFENKQHAPPSPTVNKFPVVDRQSSFFSETSTVEDILCCWNPELTLRPVPGSQRNPNGTVMSEYDNLNNLGYAVPSGVSQAGTVFSKPWDSSVWDNILKSNSALPPPMSLHERIKAWQESSHLAENEDIVTDCEREENPRFSMVSETSVETKTFGGERHSFSDFPHSSQGMLSCRTNQVTSLGNSRTELPAEQSCEESEHNDDILLFGANFREKVAPILAHPRLLHQISKHRSPDSKISEYIFRLSHDHGTTFGSTIENFIQCTLESQETSPHIVCRNIRQFMSGIKNYLVKHGEGELEDIIERERNKLGDNEILNIDAILENALHVCCLRPLKQFIYRLFVAEYTKNGNIKLIQENIKYARTKSAEEIGIRRGLPLPDDGTLETIKQYLTRMQKSYSPLKKLENLLGATSSIYKCVTARSHAGNVCPSFGADDFLPMLIYVLIHCGIVSVEIEADYMWGLLHPSLLTGEGGYYLTSFSSAILVLKNFRSMQEGKGTAHEGHLPSISDMQGFLKIAIPDELRDSIVWKTLPVRPNMNTRDVCSMIAHKFSITNPQDYGLYCLENGEEVRLQDSECPQVLKTRRVNAGKECVFAYKRNAANIAWPKSMKKS